MIYYNRREGLSSKIEMTGKSPVKRNGGGTATALLNNKEQQL